MSDRILRRPEVEALIGLKRSTIYAMMAEGSFPKSVLIGKRAIGWQESAVLGWLAKRVGSSQPAKR